MKLVVMGTGPFAVPTFEALASSEYSISGLITRPVRQGKGRSIVVNPMQEAAERLGIECRAPESANSEEAREILAEWSPDVLVVCDYGQILSPETLAAARLGGVNLHGSLLPKYRGAAPVQWAIRNGDAETGVTVIHMTPRLDAGPILAVRKTAIGPLETHEELEPRLAAMGAEPVMDSLKMLEQWDGQSPLGEKQDASLASKAPRLSKADGRIDWSQSSSEILNQVRAFKPWPGSFTFAPKRKGDPQRLLIEQLEAVNLSEVEEGDSDPSSTNPALELQDLQAGQVVLADERRLWVRTADGALSISRLQPAGKRSMEIAEYLRGQRPAVGSTLG